MASGLQFTFQVRGLEKETFGVTAFSGHEGISAIDRFLITLVSDRGTIRPDQVLDQSATLTVWQDGEALRYFNGIVAGFTVGDKGHRLTQYQLSMTSAMQRLSLCCECRIFQNMPVKDIVGTLLKAAQIPYDLAQWPAGEKREYCVQYRESDLSFIERLAAEEGISYRFEHEKDKHTAVFFDQVAAGKTHKIPYNATAGGQASEPYISSFVRHEQLRHTSATLNDYTFKNPAAELSKQSSTAETQPGHYPFYDYPGRFKAGKIGQQFSQYALERLRSDAATANGQGNQPGLSAGDRFTLLDHPDERCHNEWMTIAVQHVGTQPQAKEESGSEGATIYHNRLYVTAVNTPWRPTAGSKPWVDGPMIATVVGPEKEEIFCDDFGRVKVQFPWDRQGSHNEHSSCWVRVAQAWAGAGYGFQAIPRIGHEVIVSFLNGDPDQPVITGRTHPANAMPPYLLPNHKTRTVLKTQTHKGEGFNELRFEDEQAQEQIFIHAQKDMDVVINNDRRESIGQDSHISVGRHWLQKITENMHRTIGKNLTDRIGQDWHQTTVRDLVQVIGGKLSRKISGGTITKVEGSVVTDITASEDKKVGTDSTLEVGGNHSQKAINIVLEAGAELCIKGAGGFIKIDGSGITIQAIQGGKVNINSGGEDSAAADVSVTEPGKASKPETPTAPDTRE